MEAGILLLFGRDLPCLYMVQDPTMEQGYSMGTEARPGLSCDRECMFNSAHKPRKIATFKNHFLDNGRPSFMELCPSLLYLECEAALNDASSATCQKKRHLVNELFEGNLGTSSLVRTKDDNKPGTSVDDRTFVQIIHESQAC